MLSSVAALLMAGFVGVVLSDPSSPSRQLAEDGLSRVGSRASYVAVVLLAGALLARALLAGSTFVVARSRRRRARPE